MPLTTSMTKLLGIKHPIMCGGMHYVGYAELAAAISNAGGIGFITALTQATPEKLRLEIRKAKKLTNKPLGVNITLLPALAPPDYPAYAKVIIEEGITIIETAGRSPEKIINFFKQHKCIVIHKCVSIRHALSAIKLGADMISVDGFECAGHPGEEDVGNWVLLAQAARKLNVPFIASGGNGTGRQLAAALMMGACGINMGTRFMATHEAAIHIDIKNALVKGNEADTMLVMRSLRNTERVFKNPTAIKVAEIERENPGVIKAILPYVKGENYRKSFQETGDSQSSVWSCGQVMGLIDDIPTCKVLVERIAAEAEEVISKGQFMIIKSKL